MSILALGINHTTAPIELREKLSINSEDLPSALKDFIKLDQVNEAAILSTCNRTEIYCSHEAIKPEKPIEWLSSYHGLNGQEIKPLFYTHPDSEAVKHLLRVASGLDSMVLGEPQVLGQLKTAYQTALDSGYIGKHLNRLFQHSFRVAKVIRSKTEIGAHPVSVAFAAVRMAQQIFGDLDNQTVLLIGAGETTELVAKHLHDRNCQKLIVANRTIERAQKLATEFSGYAITLSDIPNHLPEADIIITSTASQLPILGKGAIESAIKKRKHRPVFIVDLAVPRDVEPEVGSLKDVYLYTVDDLKDVVQENLNNRKQAAIQAEEIINTQVNEFMDWFNSLTAISTITSLRQHAEQIQAETTEWALKRIQEGADAESIVKETTRLLTNKLIHTPSSQLREASAEGREDLLSATHELFSLSPESKKTTKKD